VILHCLSSCIPVSDIVPHKERVSRRSVSSHFYNVSPRLVISGKYERALLCRLDSAFVIRAYVSYIQLSPALHFVPPAPCHFVNEEHVGSIFLYAPYAMIMKLSRPPGHPRGLSFSRCLLPPSFPPTLQSVTPSLRRPSFLTVACFSRTTLRPHSFTC